MWNVHIENGSACGKKKNAWTKANEKVRTSGRGCLLMYSVFHKHNSLHRVIAVDGGKFGSCVCFLKLAWWSLCSSVRAIAQDSAKMWTHASLMNSRQEIFLLLFKSPAKTWHWVITILEKLLYLNDSLSGKTRPHCKCPPSLCCILISIDICKLCVWGFCIRCGDT